MKEIYDAFLPKYVGMNYLKRDRFLIENVTYDFWNMFILLDGTFSLGESGELVRAGDVVLFSPHKHFLRKVVEPISFLSVHFEWEAASKNDEADEAMLPNGKLSFKDSRRIISTAMLMQATSSDDAKDHCLKDIWLQFCIESYKNEPVTQNHIISDALSIIDQCALSSISLSELAHRLHISHTHLINLFKSILGVTPSEYITDLRMQKAKALLLESDFSVQKISELCGFANLYYFSSTFKKNTGLSPSLFRKIYRT